MLSPGLRGGDCSQGGTRWPHVPQRDESWCRQVQPTEPEGAPPSPLLPPPALVSSVPFSLSRSLSFLAPSPPLPLSSLGFYSAAFPCHLLNPASLSTSPTPSPPSLRPTAYKPEVTVQVKGRGPLGPGLLSLRSGLVQGLQTWNGRPWSKIHLKLRAESFPGPLCVCACTCVPCACVVCVFLGRDTTASGRFSKRFMT